ncbi:hypothetical protein BN1088_1500023 [Sphingobacterium sp. PM2-P1-29]|nr:hypothetical protein BN1088_1500023 [Sphingobacterium sp. PM2-P1-29]
MAGLIAQLQFLNIHYNEKKLVENFGSSLNFISHNRRSTCSCTCLTYSS